MMILQITIRNVYGEDKAYPANCIADRIAEIAGTKTLTKRALVAALAMGCTLEVIDRYGNVSRSWQATDQYAAADLKHVLAIA